MSPWFSDALLRAQSDDRLVMLARAGHERAFVAIVERYRRPLHAFTRRLVPEARVEDVLQQAFLNAWAALSAGAEVRHLRGWLHQIVRNAATASAVRSPGEHPLAETMIGADDPQAEVERRLAVRETLDNMARLPEHQRSAIVQTAIEGRSREEIASALGVSEGAVRALVHRARTALRAAATAITPLPLAVWAAGGRGGPSAEMIAQLVTGSGSASIAGAGVKAGAVVAVSGAVAGGLVGDHTPIVRHRSATQHPTVVARLDRSDRPHRAAVAVRAVATTVAPRSATAPARAAPAPAPARSPAPRKLAAAPRREPARAEDPAVRRHSRSGATHQHASSPLTRLGEEGADERDRTGALRADDGDGHDGPDDGDAQPTAVPAQADSGDDGGGGGDGGGQGGQPDPTQTTTTDD